VGSVHDRTRRVRGRPPDDLRPKEKEWNGTSAPARPTRDRVPWPLAREDDLVAVDTTWGELQRLEAAPGVQTVGELELIELVEQGAVAVDCRTTGSFGGRTIPGAVNISHTEMVQRRNELDPARISILFCNGPQCPQSPHAVRELLEAGHPARALAYYRGGMHDWVSLAMPTEPRED
jgi:rhodanese-related sulfurtransferase